MRYFLLFFTLFIMFFSQTAEAARIVILNSALNGGSYPWDEARADMNDNWTQTFGVTDFITVTGLVDLDALDTLVEANTVQISEFVTLSGIPAHSTDFGIFSGLVIPDNSDNKEALQALETYIETFETDTGVALAGKEPIRVADENYVTDAQLVVIGNTSGTNTDDATVGTANGLSFAGQVLSLAAATNASPGAMTASFVTNLGSLVALSGVAADSTDLGPFTGVTIPDNSDNKEALQALETAVEAGGGSMVYPGAGIPLSTGSAWNTSFTQATLAAAQDAEDHDFTGAIDTRNTTSNNSGPIVMAPTATLPTGGDIIDGKLVLYTGQTGYLGNNVLGFYDGTTFMNLSATAGVPTVDGDYKTWDVATGTWIITPAPTGGASITEVATDPSVNDLTQGQSVVSQSSGNMFFRSVTDRFYTYTGSAVLNYLVTISPVPTDGNNIVSTDGFIDCGTGSDCSYLYALNAVPEFTANIGAGQQFDNWVGDATDTSTTTNPDTMVVTGAKTFGAAFSSADAVTCSGNYGYDTISSTIVATRSATLTAIRIPVACNGTVSGLAYLLQYVDDSTAEVEYALYDDNGSGTDIADIINHYGAFSDPSTSTKVWLPDPEGISEVIAGSPDFVWFVAMLEKDISRLFYDAGTTPVRVYSGTWGVWPTTWPTGSDTEETRDYSGYITFP